MRTVKYYFSSAKYVYGVLILGLLIVFFVASSSKNTRFTGSWKNPSNTKSYSSIVVASMSSDTEARQMLENDLASLLSVEGVVAIKSADVLQSSLNEGEDVNKDEHATELKQSGAEGILTVALITKETETRYVPGTIGYEPVKHFAYYGDFSGYFMNLYPKMIAPGYFTQDKVYFIETNLYDTKTEELIWSAQSETYNPANLSSFSEEFAALVTSKLKQEQLLGKVKLK